jgi:hypothetical protein
VFLVEDSAERIKWFNQKVQRMTVACRPDWALEELNHGAPFDIVFLDHDAQWNDATKTFMSVALRLAELEFSGTVVIHSMNPVGAKRMAHVLGRHATVQVMPFGTFEIESGA